jgi:hypothetical protein
MSQDKFVSAIGEHDRHAQARLARAICENPLAPQDKGASDFLRRLYIAQADALRPDDPPLGHPEADNNVMKITDDCLFMRSATGSIHGGFGSMSWAATGVSLAIGIGVFYLMYHLCGKEIAANRYTGTVLNCFLREGVGNAYFWALFMVFPVIFSWTFLAWRRQLPIIFNRKTQQVTCYYRGRAYVQDWDTLKAYIRYSQTKFREGILDVTFTTGETCVRQPIYGTSTTELGARSGGLDRALMIWEYIRLFMREGKEALPPIAYQQEPFMPLSGYCCKNLREALEKHLPENPLRIKPWWWPLLILRFLFLSLPILALTLPTDLAYLCLDRILPRRKWPQELLEACNYVWDGANDHGPQSA